MPGAYRALNSLDLLWLRPFASLRDGVAAVQAHARGGPVIPHLTEVAYDKFSF